MKLSILPLAVACTGLLASASPMRVILVSSSVGTVDSGPVAQLHPAAVTKQQHAPCAGSRLRQKATSISEAFRIAFGFKVREKLDTSHPHLTLLTPPVHPTPIPAIDIKHYVPLPFIGTPMEGKFIEAHTKGGDKLRIVNVSGEDHRHHGHGRFRHHGKNEHSFLMRVHFALMSLGPWEGRAVAFVLGCGIGVLLRMFWVLTVLSYRLIKGPRAASEDGHEYAVILDGDAEEIFVAPPMYTYSVEKEVEVEPIAVLVPAEAK